MKGGDRRRVADEETTELGGERVSLPDTLLVRASKTGDLAAFGELIRRYQDRIYTIVYGQLLSREDALDLTQEVFIKAFRKLPEFREDCVFYT